MRPLLVLLTNVTLGVRAGTELYVRDVALALQARGHTPIAFSTVLGGVAAELTGSSVSVVDDLSQIGAPPDVIHGHHHLETLMAVLHFPAAPAINFCHGRLPWEEQPLRHPSVRKYVAVDDACRDRLVSVEGIDPARVEVILNFVDLARFRPRGPLPSKPRRALVLSNRAIQAGYVRAIRDACGRTGIVVDIAGHDSGQPTDTPEALLPGYDLVFAKGRSALEALAVGSSVVLSDGVGRGPLVTRSNVERLRRLNFGWQALDQAHDPDGYAADIARYDERDAAEASAWIRRDAGLDAAVDRLLALYAAAIDAPPGPGDPARAAADHLRRIRPALIDHANRSARIEEMAGELAKWRQRQAPSVTARLRRLLGYLVKP
jgi:hypothetical protein